MASALLSTSSFLPSITREGGSNVRNCKSLFYGQQISDQSSLRRESSGIRQGSFVVSSVVKKRETVIPDPDYRIPVVLLGLSGGLAYTNNLLASALVGLLSLLPFFQTTRVRFVFDDEALEVKVGEELKESGEIVSVGRKNCWKDGKQLYNVMVETAGPSKTKRPKIIITDWAGDKQ